MAWLCRTLRCSSSLRLKRSVGVSRDRKPRPTMLTSSIIQEFKTSIILSSFSNRTATSQYLCSCCPWTELLKNPRSKLRPIQTVECRTCLPTIPRFRYLQYRRPKTTRLLRRAPKTLCRKQIIIISLRKMIIIIIISRTRVISIKMIKLT